VTPERRLLAALASTLAPARAARLLARLAEPAPDLLRAEVARLAAAPRATRLAALGRALAAAGDAAPGSRLRVRLAPPITPAEATVPRPVDRRTDDLGLDADRSADLVSAGCEFEGPTPRLARPVERDPS
jgi:hypothetical protein